MCGIAGYFELQGERPPDRDLLVRMVSMIKYRGPDEFGAYVDNTCSLGHARLSIIDLSTGQQPLSNEDDNLWIVFNGEIFNYVELRQELETVGHRFRTHSDTEVIVHAYERWGRECLNRFNGQFAFALYDRRQRSLFLARDRMGKRPIFYTVHRGRFSFASEIKALFADASTPRRLDLVGLDQIFTWWTTAPPRTAFENISELEAGSWLEIRDGVISRGRYWHPSFPDHFDTERSIGSWAEELHALLVDAIRLRLRADVPVAAYLSGGLDSSAITALVRNFTRAKLDTFSIAFHDKAYDESPFQNEMARFLGTNHRQMRCDYHDIAATFPQVIWHTERPILRTAPTPMFLLSGLVHRSNIKVVLTGEGSDEIFGGYDIFKETLIRRFWARRPDSAWRPLLLQKLYPTLPLSAARARFYLEEFYKTGLQQVEDYHYSHMPRMYTTTRLKDFFTPEAKQAVAGSNSVEAFGKTLPEAFSRWHHLCRAQYLEMRSLLSGYLLSSQGDRVTAANAVEGRYPFLDHRLIEFAATIPPKHKILGLREKFVLKKAMTRELPDTVLNRVKQPYMAPDSNSFTQPDAPSYVGELLSERTLKEGGVFNPLMVAKLREKCTKLSHAHLSFKDNMSFIGILSTQILISRFLNGLERPETIERERFTRWFDHTSESTPAQG